jgi:hypothetical protein
LQLLRLRLLQRVHLLLLLHCLHLRGLLDNCPGAVLTLAAAGTCSQSQARDVR